MPAYTPYRQTVAMIGMAMASNAYARYLRDRRLATTITTAA